MLASRSPRRRELLERLGLTFAVRPADVDETHPPGLPPHAVPQHLAERKAQALAPLAETYLVLAADTVVVLGGEILEKPTDAEHARAMLRRLSGQTHTVVSGVALRHGNTQTSFADQTDVSIRPLTTAEIDYYVAEHKPFDKAGAYGVQDFLGLAAVTRLQGCFYNVMGLPVPRLYQELVAQGWLSLQPPLLT